MVQIKAGIQDGDLDAVAGLRATDDRGGLQPPREVRGGLGDCVRIGIGPLEEELGLDKVHRVGRRH